MPTLTVDRLSKSYDANPAVREISFEIGAGKVLALCGENGAGKSTLMKMLSGATPPDGGEIRLDGRPARFQSPADARTAGIHTVYQELSLLPHIGVAENMLLGKLPTRALGFVVDWEQARRIAARTLADFGFDGIPVDALARDLSVAQQQIVEIGKALVTPPAILILDEPTAVLSAHETAILFRAVRRLTQNGATVLYISHRLEEIFEIADEIVVLKDGRSVLQGAVHDFDQVTLIEAMVGRPLRAIFPQRRPEFGRVLLNVERLESPGRFADINFKVRAGEIVGMFGLVGSGRTEVAKAIFGATSDATGEIRIDGADARIRDPSEAVHAGMAFITEDRKGEGLALDVSVLDNVSLASLGRTSHFGVLNQAERRQLAERETRALAVRPPQLERPVRQLSGGNQQKIVLAKWMLARGTKLFIFDEPTRGVDVATKVEIYKQIATIAASGCGVLLISSEMPEVLGLSDRLIVMRQGRVAAELTPEQFSMETVFAYAAGLTPGESRSALH